MLNAKVMKKGILLAVTAYGFWDLLPIYRKSIENVPPLEILGHRVVWSVVFWMTVQIIRIVTFVYGAFPWIALILSFSFGIYELIRKTGSLGAIDGLTFETGGTADPLPALPDYSRVKRSGEFRSGSLRTTTLSSLTGVAAALPLLLFTSSVCRIPLPTMLFVLVIKKRIQ